MTENCILYPGDCREVLRELPDESVHCVVTSPPYYGLRSYLPEGHPDKEKELGAEKTPDAYVTNLVEVFREVRRVLRRDGTCWINLASSYAAQGGPQIDGTKQVNGSQTGAWNGKSRSAPSQFKSKDMIPIPWMVAMALQMDGYYLRQDVIWAKGCSGTYTGGSVMPESVTDRFTKSHEYLFLLAKSPRYFFDQEAVKETALTPGDNRAERTDNTQTYGRGGNDSRQRTGNPTGTTRNRRSVWTITTKPYNGAHFAVMPPKLVEPCILAGCPAKVCAACGAPWERVVEKPDMKNRPKRSEEAKCQQTQYQGATSAGQKYQDWRNANPDKTLGFRPTCACDADTQPGTVLDPFSGAGTTGLVALRLQRRYIGIELNPEYLALTERRLDALQPQFL